MSKLDLNIGAYPSLLQHILSGESIFPMIASPDRLQHRDEWRQFFRWMKFESPKTEDLRTRFHTQWHVCHHLIRELVDNDGLLLDVLRIWLPPYKGLDQVLFRGENLDRFETGICGWAWTDRQDVADMFASGLNAVGKGGVVLQAAVPASAIIAAPSWHSSQWLRENEFTVDVRALGTVNAIVRYPNNC